MKTPEAFSHKFVLTASEKKHLEKLMVRLPTLDFSTQNFNEQILTDID